MKAYLMTSSTIFGLITMAHVARIFAEGWNLALDPVFIVLTALSAGLCSWGCFLLKRSSEV